MTNKTKKYSNTLSIRISKDMNDMLSYLEDRKLLNKTAVIRTAVAEEFKREKSKERGEYNETI